VHRRIARIAIVAASAGVLACGVAHGSTADAASKQAPLRVLVTNDDGYGAPGIDALVEKLRKVDGVKVVVIAPSGNRSNSGTTTTPGELATTEAKTASGYPAVSVAGYPADTVIYALDQRGLRRKPDLVISGINRGQNVGLGIVASGTVGAAKTAATRGVPALAVSQGVRPDGEPDYEAGARQALAWLRHHRKALTHKPGKAAKVTLTNLNVPSCSTGRVRGLVEVPVAANDVTGFSGAQDCASTRTNPKNDVEGLLNGYATLSELPIPTQ
jgi:5'-nucleotidase